MVKKYILLLAVVILALTACSSQAAEPTQNAAPPTQAEEPATLPDPSATAVEAAPAATQIPTDAPAAPTDSPAPQPQAGSVSFASDVLPIIESRCISCHGAERAEDGLDLTSYAALMAGSENGAVLTPGDAENSLMVQLVQNGQMPKRGAKLTPQQIQIIIDWINQGAVDN